MRTRLRAAVAGSVVTAVPAVLGAQLLASPAQAGPAQASRPVGRVVVDQRYPVPASGEYAVSGHGYGHGRGMSQYGANGAAMAGLAHERILAFYYPGTVLGTARGPVRVLVTADTSADVVVRARPGLTLRDRGAERTYTLPGGVGAGRWRITADARNRDVVSYRADGAWHRWSPGGRRALAGEGEFRSPGPVTLVLPGGATATYRGGLRAVRPQPGSRDRDTLNVVGLDPYVRGVVAAEMPASWEPEAVQAQAVAARTYAVFNRRQHGDRHYDLCDTTACQVYRGVAGEHPLADAAVRATARQVLRYDGAPAFTEFSSSSGGWTVASDIPYQVAQPDPYDEWSRYHDWTDTLKASAVERRYPAVGRLRLVRVTSRDGNGQWRGRVQTMELVGSRGTVTLTGDEFRWAFALRSNWFRLR